MRCWANMPSVDKTFLIGMLASAALGGVICAIAYGIGVDPDVGGAMIALGAVGAGLIAGEVTKRMPPRRGH